MLFKDIKHDPHTFIFVIIFIFYELDLNVTVISFHWGVNVWLINNTSYVSMTCQQLYLFHTYTFILAGKIF